jgi:hypothetical protein
MLSIPEKKVEIKTFKLLYTEPEWLLLEELALRMGSKNFRSYLRKMIWDLAEKVNPSNIFPCPCLDGTKTNKLQRIYDVPIREIEEITILQSRYCNDIGTIIKRFISDPLLSVHFKEKGY